MEIRSAAYGIDAAEFTDDKLKDQVVEAWGITRRQMLINLGEAMRGTDVDHWVKAWRRAVAQVRWQVRGDRLWNSPSILDCGRFLNSLSGRASSFLRGLTRPG